MMSQSTYQVSHFHCVPRDLAVVEGETCLRNLASCLLCICVSIMIIDPDIFSRNAKQSQINAYCLEAYTLALHETFEFQRLHVTGILMSPHPRHRV